MKVTFKVEGLKELDRALGQLPKAVAARAMTSALIDAAKPIQEAAQAAAPVGTEPGGRYYTRKSGERILRQRGTLKALVQIGTRLTQRQRRAARRAGKNFSEIYIGTRDRVGLLVEFGTRKVAPNPFLRNAWDSGKGALLDKIKDLLWQRLSAAAKRQARRGARKVKV